jgi:hypothetical protein
VNLYRIQQTKKIVVNQILSSDMVIRDATETIAAVTASVSSIASINSSKGHPRHGPPANPTYWQYGKSGLQTSMWVPPQPETAEIALKAVSMGDTARQQYHRNGQTFRI